MYNGTQEPSTIARRKTQPRLVCLCIQHLRLARFGDSTHTCTTGKSGELGHRCIDIDSLHIHTSKQPGQPNIHKRCQMESIPEKIFIIQEHLDGEKVGLPIFYGPHFMVCRLHYSNINAESLISNVFFQILPRVERRHLSAFFVKIFC